VEMAIRFRGHLHNHVEAENTHSCACNTIKYFLFLFRDMQ